MHCDAFHACIECGINQAMGDQTEHFLYAVAKGRHIGIYVDWGLCQRQVDQFSGNSYKKFTEVNDCVRYLLAHSSLSRSEICVFIDDPEDGIPLKDFKFEMAKSFWNSAVTTDITNNGNDDETMVKDRYVNIPHSQTIVDNNEYESSSNVIFNPVLAYCYGYVYYRPYK